jgi:hypothetical protein
LPKNKDELVPMNNLNADETGLSLRQFLIQIYNGDEDYPDYYDDYDRILASREVYVFVSETIVDDPLRLFALDRSL